MNLKKIIRRQEKLEHFLQMAQEEATAIRREVEGGNSASPLRGKGQKQKSLENKLIANRNMAIMRARNKNNN